MFTVDDISIRCVERNTFSRGELIYKVGNVKHFHTEPIKKEHRVKIRANIKGNNIENFDAEAVVDEITGSIEKVKCSCADGAKSEELCRHCVAMLLEYIRQRDGSNMVAVRAEGFHKRTDPEVLDILERFALEKRAGYIQPDLTGQVKIVPEIEIAADKTLDVEFRVGIHNLYIVKSVVTFAEDSDIVNLHGWSQGSFSGMSWSNVEVAATVIGVTVVLTFFLSKPIGAYQLGEAYAQSMGVNIRFFRVALILLSSVLSASVTAFAGPISFVGIAVPYLIKHALQTSKPLVVIPGTFIGGAVFCMICDLIARMAFAPMELNISTVTSIFGAPIVIFMMVHGQKGR